MADIPVPGHQAFWIDKRKALKLEYKKLLNQPPNADVQLKQLFKVLCYIEDVAGYIPASVGDSDQWSSIINTAEENRKNFCKAIGRKTLYSALYDTYTVALQELKTLLKASITADRTPTPKSASIQEEVSLNFGGGSDKAASKPPKRQKSSANCSVYPRRHFRQSHHEKILRPTEDNVYGHRHFRFGEHSTRRGGPGENVQATPINLTSSTNLIQLQKQLKNVVKEDYEFHNTRNGTRVIKRNMVDFLPIKSHFEGNNLYFFNFYPKSKKPIMAVISHLPLNTPAEDICNGLVSLDFDVVSVKQMTTTRLSPPEKSKTTNLPFSS
jgi:hypothetical protein